MTLRLQRLLRFDVQPSFSAVLYKRQTSRYVAGRLMCVGGRRQSVRWWSAAWFSAADKQGTRCESGTAPPL